MTRLPKTICNIRWNVTKGQMNGKYLCSTRVCLRNNKAKNPLNKDSCKQDKRLQKQINGKDVIRVHY